jgi:hypothetical protein
MGPELQLYCCTLCFQVLKIIVDHPVYGHWMLFMVLLKIKHKLQNKCKEGRKVLEQCVVE